MFWASIEILPKALLEHKKGFVTSPWGLRIGRGALRKWWTPLEGDTSVDVLRSGHQGRRDRRDCQAEGAA